jgi:Arc/MetJ-type ribon-helix-helix transcriptional regulator
VLLDRTPGQPGKENTAASDLTPVMARLGPAELEIVDTLISAGIAPNRAEAIRWSLARISERPAYAQLRERTREIERLTSEF